MVNLRVQKREFGVLFVPRHGCTISRNMLSLQYLCVVPPVDPVIGSELSICEYSGAGLEP